MDSKFPLQEWQVKLGSIWFLSIEDSHPWSCTLWRITRNFTFIKAQSHIHAMIMSMKPYHNFYGCTKSIFLLCVFNILVMEVLCDMRHCKSNPGVNFSLLSYCTISVVYQMLTDILHAKGSQHALLFRSYSWLSGKGAGKQKFQLWSYSVSQVQIMNGLEFWYS